ncbi:hypothetical protein D3C79_912000 [compost metagenome]
MSYCHILLTHWKMSLKVGKINVVCFTAPVGELPPALPLLLQEIRLLPALVDEEAAELQILLFTRKPVQLYECKFNFLMPVITLELTLFRAKNSINMINHPAHDV